MTNEEKARELATRWKAKGLPYNAIYETAIEVMEWKDEQLAKEKKQMVARANTFIKEIARVCDITDENGYRVDERYLLAEFEKKLKGE